MVAHDFPLETSAFNGGVTAATFYLADALRDTGEIELEIIRPFAPAGLQGVQEVAGLRVHTLSFPRWEPRNFHSLWSVRTAVREKLRQLRPDVIHVQNHTIIAANLPSEKTVLTTHGIREKDVLFRGKWRFLKSNLMALLERNSRRRVKNLICISPYARQHIAPNDTVRCWDIANPVPQHYFDIQRMPRPGVVFSPAKITELKNTSGLIRAFASLAKTVPHAELRLAGCLEDRDYVQRCRKLATSLNVANRVSFMGILSVERMHRELAEAICLALCSFQENAPLAIGEAMAAGVPVLAANVGGVASMVENGVTGILVRPEDGEGIAKALAELLSKNNLSVMAAAAKAKALAEYHSNAVARKTLAVYKALAGSTHQ